MNSIKQNKLIENQLTDCNRKLNNNHLFTGGGSLLDITMELKLNEFYGVKYQQWKLLYKATRDGFTASTFHELCDDKGSTMVIIKSSEGWLFGGFTSQSWKALAYKTDPKAFLFTLTNPHSIPPSSFVVNNSLRQYAILCNNAYGPIFGNAADIFIADNSNTNSHSYINFPKVYLDTTYKGNLLFTGNQKLTTNEIEVYSLDV